MGIQPDFEDSGSVSTELTDETDVLSAVLAALRSVKPATRKRIIDTVSVFFGLSPTSSPGQGGTSSGRDNASSGSTTFSEDRTISPKEFLSQKMPRTDVERVACLAYYLTHYRSAPYFRTLDISKLNTEAAQLKFANAANTVNNATSYGYLAPATKGNKQVSALGERFVEALPDYEAARAVLTQGRPRRRAKRKASNGSN